MRKKDVPIVTQKMLNIMVKPNNISNGFDVSNASKLSFGEDLTTVCDADNIGLNYGLLKVIVLDNYINFQDIAHSNLNKLKTIGLTKNQKSYLIIENINTLSMTQHIFTKMAA